MNRLYMRDLKTKYSIAEIEAAVAEEIIKIPGIIGAVTRNIAVRLEIKPPSGSIGTPLLEVLKGK